MGGFLIYIPTLLNSNPLLHISQSVGDKGMEERARDSRNRILEFFNVTDALEVTWAHAVNSQEKLQEALTGEVNMNCFQSEFF